MGHWKFLILAFLGATAFIFCLVPGCSIKEDRDSCPWVLTLNMSEVEDDDFDALMVGVYGVSELSDTLSPPFEEEYVFYLERGSNEVSIASVATDNGSTVIGYGSDCPELWLWYREWNFYGEAAADTVKMHKQYCCLTLKAVSALEDESYPFALVVTGNVSGYERDGTPVEGDFYVIRNPSSQGWCSLNLPRQTDNSLRLELMSESETVRTFAIGEYIAESGYDWDAEDLEDITMEIDFAKTTIKLSTDRWSTILSFDIKI